MDVAAFAMCQHQIRPFTFGNNAAIVEIQCLRRIAGHQTNRLRQCKAVGVVIRYAKCRVEQAGG